VFVCLFANTRTLELFDVIVKVLWEQGMVKSSDEFENG